MRVLCFVGGNDEKLCLAYNVIVTAEIPGTWGNNSVKILIHNSFPTNINPVFKQVDIRLIKIRLLCTFHLLETYFFKYLSTPEIVTYKFVRYTQTKAQKK